MAIKLGADSIPLLFIGEMGIKSGYAGKARVYERGGGYLFLELYSQRVPFVPKNATALITKDGQKFCVE